MSKSITVKTVPNFQDILRRDGKFYYFSAGFIQRMIAAEGEDDVFSVLHGCPFDLAEDQEEAQRIYNDATYIVLTNE